MLAPWDLEPNFSEGQTPFLGGSCLSSVYLRRRGTTESYFCRVGLEWVESTGVQRNCLADVLHGILAGGLLVRLLPAVCLAIHQGGIQFSSKESEADGSLSCLC